MIGIKTLKQKFQGLYHVTGKSMNSYPGHILKMLEEKSVTDE